MTAHLPPADLYGFCAWFRSPTTGDAIAYRNSSPFRDGDLLVARPSDPTGGIWREMAVSGFGGGDLSHEITFADPRDGIERRLQRQGRVITAGLDRFEQQDEAPPAMRVVPLPPDRRPEYLFRNPDAFVIYVSDAKYRASYETFRLFMGNEPPNAAGLWSLRPVEIVDVARYRDGGTTYVRTVEGVLYSPAPGARRSEGPSGPSWIDLDGKRTALMQARLWRRGKGRVATPLFDIVETDAGATVALREEGREEAMVDP